MLEARLWELLLPGQLQRLASLEGKLIPKQGTYLAQLAAHLTDAHQYLKNPD